MNREQSKRPTVETEAKIACQENPLTNHPGIELTRIIPRDFEDNWLLDYDDHRLAFSQCVLRLRMVSGRGWLTFKSAPREHPCLKVREEIEVTVDNPELMLAILESIGLHRVFRYQKFRSLYRIKLPSGTELDAMFDETPMGNFLELEGPDQAIAEAVKLLSIPGQNLTQSSYPALWAEYLQAKGQPSRDMVFSDHHLREG